MKIEPVTEENFLAALGVYTASWRESHTEICSGEFLEKRDYSGYLRKRLDGLFLLTADVPVGIIRCKGGEIGDLYILPDRQSRGFGTALLRFALRRGGDFTLNVLSSNCRAIRLYEKFGFRLTGEKILLREGLWELEMKYWEKDNG